MYPFPVITVLLMALNLLVSAKGLTSESFIERFSFRIDDILIHKQFYRMVTSGFLHVSWIHLIFNIITLYAFGRTLEPFLGSGVFLVVYLAGLVGGNLLATFIHRQHGDYSAVGASGAVCGIVFASIAVFPGLDITMFSVTFGIPGWLYGLVYVLYTIYGVRSQSDNIGHEAHLGGALVGMFVALMFVPSVMIVNYVTVIVICLPALAFIYLIITRPYILYIDNRYFNQHRNATIEDRYNLAKVTQQKEIDQILEKIHQKGINSLTKEEREKLADYSKGE